MEDACVVCGQYVPEGRMVCQRCENTILDFDSGGFMNNQTQREKGKFDIAGEQLGNLVENKQKAYGDSISKTGDLLKVFLSGYDTGEGFLIPYSLVDHIGMMVRIIDKQNRVFSNPDFDLMGESPYKDIAGYGLLGDVLLDRRVKE